MIATECLIKAVTKENAQREAIIDFLSNFENERQNKDSWCRKLSSWWEENPFYEEEIPRGWLLEANGAVVGFLGVIVTDYLYQGRIYKALNATTWRVTKEHRSQSMSLFLQFYNQKEKFILVNSTPDDTVEKILQLAGFKSHKGRLSSVIFPLRDETGGLRPSAIFGNIFQKLYRQILPQGDCRCADSQDKISFKAPDDRYKDYLVKRKDSSYLRWFLSLGSNRKIIGYFSKDNEISSFAVFEKSKVKDCNALRILDYFVGDKDGGELLSIINYACDHPGLLGDSANYRFLVLNFFPDNEISIKLPSLSLRKQSRSRLYYILPEELKDVRMLNYISEGDFGLL